VTLKQKKQALRASVATTRGADQQREDEGPKSDASSRPEAGGQQGGWVAMKAPSRAPSRAGRQRAPRAQKQPPQERARPPPLPVLVDHADLRTLFGIKYSRVHLWRLIRDGKFPPPVWLYDGGIRKLWRSQDVEAWLAALTYAAKPVCPLE
jgi:predicted DNA-binding transcriptional regulator AlpA